MQEEIRRIVEAMNEGRKSVSKQNMQKVHAKQNFCDNRDRALTSRNTGDKSERRESQLGPNRNFDRMGRNKA